MKITLTGATGLIGRRLVQRLTERGDEVTVLSRNAEKAAAALGVEAVAWDPSAQSAPSDALAGRDAIVHLAGEPVAQRWTDSAKAKIRESRTEGTRNLVDGIEATTDRPEALISSSAVGYYGKHGDEPVPESTPPGDDFLASVCVQWEREADRAAGLGLRVAHIRTGVVLDKDGGALKKMLPFFKIGIGGPVAGGNQYLPWVHADDLVAMYLGAIDGDWRGSYNGAAPQPVTNKEFSKALGRALHRPAFAPVPGFAVGLLYGRMAEIVTEGQRAVPERPLAEGFSFQHTDVEAALRDVLS